MDFFHPLPYSDIPEQFNDPFRYRPHTLVQEAAGILLDKIRNDNNLEAIFSEGKMLGVLIAGKPSQEKADEYDRIGFLAAFSGNAGGRNHIDGFVPPIYDLLDPDGTFKKGEAEISEINRKLKELDETGVVRNQTILLQKAEQARNEEISSMKAMMALAKAKRDGIRNETESNSELDALIKESQYQKAELKRLRDRWNSEISAIKRSLANAQDEIIRLKHERSTLSEALQKWIFDRYIVHNALGEESSISDIFASEGTVPPGGTGECAAPKLLEHAYRCGLTPLAMGEFWYGRPSPTAVRTQGHFYPSCTSKCGPLLGFMTKGLSIHSHESVQETPRIIYEDNSVIAASKPAGMPSVPGLDGRESLLEHLEREVMKGLHPVHRLDMDTSGIILFAKDNKTALHLRRQFEEHSIRKTYLARLSSCPEGIPLHSGATGVIDIPLSPDYDERPRQKIDPVQGKHAKTEYTVKGTDGYGNIDIIFHPVTGRTHQLRVHSAHSRGLGHPIIGDMLYGGASADRLHLHARSISFTHPDTGKEVTLETDLHMYK